MKVQDKKWIRYRIYLVAVFFIIGTGVILYRAFQLQVLERDKLESIARAGYQGEIQLLPKRGIIYDREGHELAVSVNVGSVYANPKLIKDKVKISQLLALNLNRKQSEILSLIKSNRSFVWVERRISPEKVTQIRELNLKGIGFAFETKRFYPGREIAAHLIGFAGADNQGLEGLERKYDEILRGPTHTLVRMKDALGRSFYVDKPPGDLDTIHNLTLTIDKDIQYKAQQALEAAVQKSKGKSGQCLIMNPQTGEIVAMAVVPSFNPNVFDRHKPYEWRNRVITDCYEPGSAIKAFLLAAALEKNAVSPNTLFDCENGNYRIANRIIHDTKKHGPLTVSDIIVLSSNIGAVKIGWELGYQRFYDYLLRFGFGSKTEIDLLGERNGFIRPVGESRQIDMATTFFGQGMSATTLQLGVAMSAVANGGKLMRPYVVKKITDQSGRVIEETHPYMVRRVISEDTAQKTVRILEDVVSDRGTAPLASISGYRVAGKTGTSQKVDPATGRYSNKDYVAIFAGFVPADDPKLVIVVMVDEPRGQIYGGIIAAPVFKEVGAWALNNLRINPKIRTATIESSLVEGQKSKTVTQDGDAAEADTQGLLPDFTGRSMRQVLKEVGGLGIDVEVEGTGLAFKQFPLPGALIDKVSTVRVSFRPPSENAG